MSDGSPFTALHVNQVRDELPRLCQQVSAQKGRIEITHSDDQGTCVLISKEELDSLEQAIEILSDGDGVRAMRDSLAQVISQAEPVA